MHIRAFQSSASVKRYLHGRISLRDYRLSISVLVLQSCLIMSSIRFTGRLHLVYVSQSLS